MSCLGATATQVVPGCSKCCEGMALCRLVDFVLSWEPSHLVRSHADKRSEEPSPPSQKKRRTNPADSDGAAVRDPTRQSILTFASFVLTL